MKKLVGFYVIFGLVENLFAAEPLSPPQAPSEPFVTNDLNRIDAQQQQRQIEQTASQSEQFRSQADVRTDTTQQYAAAFPEREFPCYTVQHIILTDYPDDGESAVSHFQWALNKTIKELNMTLPHCFGGEGLSVLVKQVQNNIIEKGYVTTRVVAPEQDLTDGVFHLTVIPGRIRRTIVTDASKIPWFSWLTAKTATAFERGDVLNIRDIEQTLENLKRIPTADADIEIIPSEGEKAQLGESGLKITYKQTFPFRITLGMDDSGSKSTGKWQGFTALSWDNVFSANDSFYTSFTHSMKRHTDNDGRRASKSVGFYYSIPFGYWQFSTSFYKHQYHQEISGAFDNNYIYSGKSEYMNFLLSYLLYRDAVRKTTISGGFWSRHSKNYIDGSEIDVQRRRMAGWLAQLSHTEYIDAATLKLTVGYKRGTGMRHSLDAPEESYGEGTSRPQIITAEVDFNYPFSIGGQAWEFNTNWQAQWNRTPLILQDQFSIGGRYTVRGTDGELMLYGERGWLWRNDLSWNIANKGQWLYFALDGGRVTGRANDECIGHHLIGSAVGIRGGWNGFYYDFFTGWPISKPDGFKTSDHVTGFSIGYSF